MTEVSPLRTQVDTAAVLEQLQDLIWDPAIEPGKLRRVQGMLEVIAKDLRKDTRSVQRGPELSRRAGEMLSYIRSYFAEYGHAPAIRDIQHGMRYKSPSSVMPHLRELMASGSIVLPGRRARSMRLVEDPR
jgi:sulfur relay (sulfurtransferase) DsrC/TusE family protein